MIIHSKWACFLPNIFSSRKFAEKKAGCRQLAVLRKIKYFLFATFDLHALLQTQTLPCFHLCPKEELWKRRYLMPVPQGIYVPLRLIVAQAFLVGHIENIGSIFRQCKRACFVANTENIDFLQNSRNIRASGFLSANFTQKFSAGNMIIYNG